MNRPSILDLFKQIAPTYDPSHIVSHLNQKFNSIEHDVLHQRITEFLKFMYLRSLYGTGFIPLLAEVDDIWHEFILQTQEYERFCQALPGKQFIHHNSVHLEDFAKGQDKKAIIQNLLAWLPNYSYHFGQFTPETARYWLMVSFLQDELGMTLEQINSLADVNASAIES